MKIPYTTIARLNPRGAAAFPDRPYVSLPLLRFALRHKSKKFEISALVDSGADISIFPMDIAELLEVNLSKCETYPIVGINGQAINVKLHEVDFLLDKHCFKIKAGFSESAKFASSIGAAGIIGHRGFFDRFIVIFNYKENYFEIKEKILIQI